MKALLALLLIFLGGCSAINAASTAHIASVENFDLTRYMGTWYEITRMPHRFERNLQQVTATYILQDNGSVSVLNRGFNTKKNKWSEAKGKAWMPDSATPSQLKVQFFWPFSGAYRIIYLTPDYSLAVVTSSSTKYFWILSRTPTVDEQTYAHLMAMASAWGFDTQQFIRVKHL
jgi:apolipoprotein D and lipocalin family protein